MSDNGPSGDTLSIAALAVALVALIVALGQILGQYFATAEGYRRCQPSVMGPWARKTRMQWRWSQFRFETFFTTPELVLRDYALRDIGFYGNTSSPGRNDSVFILPPKPGSHCSPPSPMDELLDMTECNEMVCWIPFLKSLYQNEKELSTQRCYYRSDDTSQLAKPGVIFRERSWDFMSPEIVRPFAVTNISDIGVMARRLGMTWTDFRPEDGIMRAEGNGHVLSSTLVRSIGMILQYMDVRPPDSAITLSRPSFQSNRTLHQSNLYIPTREVDKLGFGILPGYKALSIPNFKIGTINEVFAAMNSLDNSHQASKTIKDVRGIEPTCTFGFSDLIPLAAPMMRARGSTVIGLPIPTEHHVGLTCHKEGFVVFYNRLKEYIAGKNGAASDRINWVLDCYEYLRGKYTEWEDENEANDQANNRNLEFLEIVHTYWDNTSEYFITLEKMEKGLRYFDLMASHTSHAVNYWGDAWKNIRRDEGAKPRNHYGLCNWIAEGAHKYFDYLPLIAEDMARKGANFDLVEEAWIVMMFRAFCWWRCHYMNPGENIPLRIPSRYWDSKLPVYIG